MTWNDGGQGYACGEKKAGGVERISMVVSPKRKQGILSHFLRCAASKSMKARLFIRVPDSSKTWTKTVLIERSRSRFWRAKHLGERRLRLRTDRSVQRP